jgi:signal transduction histidine kinase
MDKIINILHLEDSVYDSELVSSLIEESEINHKYFCIDNEKEYLEILEVENIDIILSDYNLPGFNGNEALKIAREQYSNIPFIFVSGMMGEDAAIEAMLNGATDYVLKNKMDRLIPAIKRAINEQELENNRIKSAITLQENSKQLILQNEKYILVNKELAFQNEEKEKRASELAIANKELIYQNQEKEKRASELAIANEELAYQNLQKEKRASELAIANEELAYQNLQKEKRASELAIANEELAYQNLQKEKRASELAIANEELAYQNLEKEKRASELAIANEELAYQNLEKEKRAAELVIANKELIFQNQEKEIRAEELIIARVKAEESDNLKTAFLQNITHEIRTPLNEIIGLSNLLNKDDVTKIDSTEYTSMIAQSGLRLIEIIGNIIEISKIQTRQIIIVKKNFIIYSLLFEIHYAILYINKNKNIQINLVIPENNLLTAFSDESKINQIFVILIKNAIKFTKSGSIDFGYTIQDDCYQFYVKDTGIGISEDLHQKIFGKFIQAESSLSRSYEGAGLGLSICKGLVEILGGKIWVESKLGSGSTFYFTIPI